MKILFLLPTLEYCGSARQALTLGPRLARGGHKVHVATLGPVGPWGDELGRQGIVVHPLGWLRGLDPVPLWRLRRLLAALKPDVIHAWRLSTVRCLGLVGRRYLPRVLVSRLPSGRPLQPTRFSRLDLWLLRRVAAVAAGSEYEMDYLIRGGVPREKISLVVPGVDVAPSMEAASTNREQVADPASSHPQQGPMTLAFLGRLHRGSGGRDALWIGDILAHVHAQVSLRVMGSGPEANPLRGFAGRLYNPERCLILGPVPDPTLHMQMAQSSLCLLPTQCWGGAYPALEAMAAGCPALAYDQPHLRGLVRDGETGSLTPAGDVLALARSAEALLNDADRRQAMSEQARRHVDRYFAADIMAAICAELYRKASVAA